MFGAKPPVTIRPTPPRARSAKYAARRWKCLRLSSRPVCIEPISTRFLSLVKPRFSGASRCGYRFDNGGLPGDDERLMGFAPGRPRERLRFRPMHPRTLTALRAPVTALVILAAGTAAAAGPTQIPTEDFFRPAGYQMAK